MATSPYINSKGYSNERNLVNTLVEETIKLAGFDVYYIPRVHNNLDNILGEDQQSSFGIAIPIEIYLEDHSSPTGQSDILKSFGVEIRDSYKLSISPVRFREAIASTGVLGVPTRPREGDLIYFNLQHDYDPELILMEIKFLEHETPHYQLAQESIWKLDCEMFRFSNEKFATGIPTLDNYASTIGVDTTAYRLQLETSGNILLESGNGSIVLDTPWHNEVMTERKFADNDLLQTEAKTVVDGWDIKSPFGNF